VSMNKKISNISLLRENRKALRRDSTPQEIILWSRLRNKQLGYKFRRQHSFDNYIVDFYCPKKNLIVEVDGSQHIDQKEYDAERTRYFKTRGLRVVRFWNSEINNNIQGVVMRIMELLE